MGEVNHYFGNNGWEMGTPLKIRDHGYRYRPLGQNRGYGKGLMGLMEDEGNCYATEMKSTDISYVDAIDLLSSRFLAAFESGAIKTAEDSGEFKKSSYRFYACWRSGWNCFVGVGGTSQEALDDLKSDLTTHLKRLRNDIEYRNFHIKEGEGPRFDYAGNFRHLATTPARSRRARRILRLLGASKK